MKYKTIQALMMGALLAAGACIAAEPKKGCIDRPSAPVKKCVDRYGQGPKRFPLVCAILPANSVEAIIGRRVLSAAPSREPTDLMSESGCRYLSEAHGVVMASISCAYRRDGMDGGLNASWVKNATGRDIQDVGDGAKWDGGSLQSVKGACFLDVTIAAGGKPITPAEYRPNEGNANRLAEAAEISRAILEHY